MTAQRLLFKFLYFLLLLALPVSGFAFSCQDVTEIPVSECEALVALYDSTDGDNWTDNTGWKQNNTPCSWNRVLCENGNIYELSLIDNNLHGKIPTELGNLSHLFALSLSNNKLNGEIPAELANINSLAIIELQYNQLTGNLPAALGNLSNLLLIRLNNNQLDGKIPAEFGNFTKLHEIHLNNNQLTGKIPPEIGNISAYKISLNNNQLSGEIPKLKTFLAYLNLTSNNLCRNPNTDYSHTEVNEFPICGTPEAFTCADVTEIPQSECEALVNIYNDLDGDNWTNNAGWLQTNNPCTSWYNLGCKNGHVTDIALEENNLSGIVPSLTALTELEALPIGNNPNITGTVPDIGSLTKLYHFSIDGTGVSGSIPSSVLGATSLRELGLSNTNLSGELPDFSQLTNLQELNLAQTNFTGAVPSLPSNLTLLNFTDTDLCRAPNTDYGYTQVNDLPICLATNSADDLQKELMLHFNMDGNIQDHSGQEHHGVGGQITFEPSPIGGQAAFFNGSKKGGIKIPDASDFSFNNQSFSYSVWVKIYDHQSNYYRGYITLSNPNGVPRLEMAKGRGRAYGHKIYMQVYPGGSESMALSNDVPPLHEWLHLASVVDYGNKVNKLYINGELHRTQPLVDFNISSPILTIGSYSRTFGNLLLGHYGLMDEVRIYGRALSESEVIKLAQASPAVEKGNDMSIEIGDTAKLQISFDDVDKSGPYTYRWAFGDGNSVTGTVEQVGDISVDYTYMQEDEFIVELEITDNDGNSGKTQFTVNVSLKSCEHITQIPQDECYALQQLYTNTNGKSWTNNNNWFKSQYPCDWHGVRCENGRVTELDLENNNLQGEIPSELGALKDMEALSLANNQIQGELPDISTLTHLETLQLGQNQLNGEIPNLDTLVSLEHLDLSDNQLTGSIPATDGLTLLENMFLDDNNLSGSIPNFTGLPNLEVVRLDNDGDMCRQPNVDYSAFPQFASYPICNDTLLMVYSSGTGAGDISTSDGQIQCGETCQARYPQGTSLQLTATPQPDSRFVQWSNGCQGTEPTIMVEMRGNRACKAMFELEMSEDKRLLTLNKHGDGTGKVRVKANGQITQTCNYYQCNEPLSGVYEKDTTVTITAMEGTDARFTGWSGDCSGTDKTVTLNLSESMLCEATFVLDLPPEPGRHVLEIKKQGLLGLGEGLVMTDSRWGGGIHCGDNCKNTYKKNKLITLTAFPEPFSNFYAWGGDCVGGGYEYRTTISIKMDGDKQCTAIFNSDFIEAAEDMTEDFYVEGQLNTGEDLSQIYPPSLNKDRLDTAFFYVLPVVRILDLQVDLDLPSDTWPDQLNDINLGLKGYKLLSIKIMDKDYVEVIVELKTATGGEEILPIILYYGEQPPDIARAELEKQARWRSYRFCFFPRRRCCSWW